jgi:single-strand DNA-binding protein
MSTVIIGRLTADPELKFVGNKGTALATFSVAVNRKKGEEEVTHYFDCSAWGSLAENLTSLRKGQRVIVSGQLNQDTYENKEGKKVSKVVINVQNAGPDLTYATATVAEARKSDPKHNSGDSDF